jgi:predicted TIM-barrel fold metal-dependent hydrolase
MRFYDATCSYGHKRRNFPAHETALGDVLAEMDKAGVEKAVLFHHVQDSSVALGNGLTADDVKANEKLYGIWSMLPASTGETPPPEALPALMKCSKIIGLRFNPDKQHFHTRGVSSYLHMAQERRIPVFVNTGHDMQFNHVWDILTAFPNLVLILSHWNCWPSDRILRPLLESFPNFYLSLSNQFTQDGIESLRDFCGAGRLMYGSDFPDAYFGAQMLNILHARIPGEDKEKIASGNLERVINQINWEGTA